jgi:transcriptional regulator with XRE-family HTH domain
MAPVAKLPQMMAGMGTTMANAASLRDLRGANDDVHERGSTDAIDAYVGSRLRARRVEVGLSQGSLGNALGITFSQVQKYEKGSNRIGAGRLYHLATILGVSVPYFYEGLDEQKLELATKRDPLATDDMARLKETFTKIHDAHTRKALLALASSLVKRS